MGAAPGYYINVGLFADEANARKAQAQLLNEGFPAFRQELHNSQGRRIRVRAGPYESRAQADGAAKAIRTLALDAVVFKKKRFVKCICPGALFGWVLRAPVCLTDADTCRLE